jgi:hypothetical protein
MRVIAVIDDPRLVQKILRHLVAWHAPPASLSPPGGSRPYIYAPCGDTDPMPDYENVLTDREPFFHWPAGVGLCVGAGFP